MPSTWIKRRGKNWRVYWREEGKQKSINCGPTREYAEQFLVTKRKELFAIQLGIKIDTQTKWTDFAKDYLEYCQAHKAYTTFKYFEVPVVQSFMSFIGDMPLRTITPEIIEKWRIELLQKYSSTSVRMKLVHLKAMFGYAKQLGLIETNPVANIKLPKPIAVGRVLTNEEIQRLIGALPKNIIPPILVALYTGMRINEVMSLKGGTIRGSDIHLEAQGTKSRKSRVIPIHPAIKDLLCNKPSNEKIFKIGTKWVQEALKRATDRADLGRIRFHDLRHTFATNYMIKTGDLFGLMAICGWASVNSAKPYQHLVRGRIDAITQLDYGHLASPVLPNRGIKQTGDIKKV